MLPDKLIAKPVTASDAETGAYLPRDAYLPGKG